MSMACLGSNLHAAYKCNSIAAGHRGENGRKSNKMGENGTDETAKGVKFRKSGSLNREFIWVRVGIRRDGAL